MSAQFTDIKTRLQRLVEKRNYFFKATTRADAKRYLDRRRWFVGMQEEQVAKLEADLGQSFPADFRAYLLEFGENCGELFCLGQDLNPRELLENQAYCRELLEDNGITNFLREDTLFFELHQGYACSFFHRDERGEVVVYQYVEGNPAPKKAFVNFTAMLNSEVKNLEHIHAGMSKSDGYFVMISGGYVQMQHPARSSGIVPRQVGDQFLD